VRKIVVYELLSLDGVAEDPDSFFADWDDAMDANLAAVIATQDAVILGHRSYTEWAQFWPSSQIEPFATFINGVTKHVATSTPLDRDRANTAVIDGGLVGSVYRRRRTTTPRRFAFDPARNDPKRDLTDWLSARRLSRYSLELGNNGQTWSPPASRTPRDRRARPRCEIRSFSPRSSSAIVRSHPSGTKIGS
jgi:hypothetical protein